MNFNVSKALGLNQLVDVNINSFLILEGKEYELEQFRINFSQEVDHKGRPQTETQGGQFHLMITNAADFKLYDWAKRETKKKDGSVIFKTDSQGTILDISFENASCIRLDYQVNSLLGSKTSLTISPERISIGRFTHDNRWKK